MGGRGKRKAPELCREVWLSRDPEPHDSTVANLWRWEPQYCPRDGWIGRTNDSHQGSVPVEFLDYSAPTNRPIRVRLRVEVVE